MTKTFFLLAIAFLFFATHPVWADTTALVKAANDLYSYAQRASRIETLEELKSAAEQIGSKAEEVQTAAYEVQEKCSSDIVEEMISHIRDVVSFASEASAAGKLKDVQDYVSKAAEAAERTAETAKNVSFQCKK